MLKFISLSSGSNGNCYYIGDDENGLLIDAGIGGRTIKKRLTTAGVSMDTLKFILVTHDHIDHIKHLGSVSHRLSLPVFGTPRLHTALSNHACTREHVPSNARHLTMFEPSDYFGFEFTPFLVPHDASETLGYRIRYKDSVIVFITDVGALNETIVDYCSGCNHIIIESNYDLDMLMSGSYPPELKHRIINGYGHLSNEQCASLLKRIYHDGLKSVFLCHLSENNNTPERALEYVERALTEKNRETKENLLLRSLPRRSSSELFHLL